MTEKRASARRRPCRRDVLVTRCLQTSSVMASPYSTSRAFWVDFAAGIGKVFHVGSRPTLLRGGHFCKAGLPPGGIGLREFARDAHEWARLAPRRRRCPGVIRTLFSSQFFDLPGQLPRPECAPERWREESALASNRARPGPGRPGQSQWTRGSGACFVRPMGTV